MSANEKLLSQEILLEFYSKGKSMAEMAKYFNCSINRIVYWMNKYDIKRRNQSDALYVKLNPNGDPFLIKTNRSPTEQVLYGIGIGIYWGEGEKVSKGKVRVANTDPNLILTFRKFLEIICQASLARIHYSIICFNDSDPSKVASYWSKILMTPEKKFGKIVQIPSQGRGTYRKKSEHGVCIIEISNIKLKRWIMQELNVLKS